MYVTELWVADGSRRWNEVQWDLFLVRDVRGVLPTADPDRVLVVHGAPADPERWRALLRDGGFLVDPSPHPQA